MERFFIPRKAWLDITLLATALVAVNLLVSRGNMGWLDVQPTPYLLLPLLAGLRYGMGAGLFAGVASFLIASSGHCVGGPMPWFGFLRATHGLLWSSVILGAVCGEVQFESRRVRSAHAVRNRDLEQRLRTLDDELVLLRRAKDELTRMVALRDREKSSLDTGLRWLSASSAQQLPRNTLQLLNRQTRVTDAALYYLEPGTGSMHREALLGQEEHLPPRIDPHSVEIARMALQRKKLIPVPELLSCVPGIRQNYLAAVPFATSQGEPFGLLLITGMPFTAFTPDAVKLIALICQWAAGFIELKDESLGRYRLVEGSGENRKIFSRDFFTHVVRISSEAFQQQRAPASLVLVCLPTAPRSLQPELESVLMRLMRTGDYAAQFGLDVPHLVVLLPLTGERGSAIFVDRVRSAWDRKDYELAAYKMTLEQESDLDALLCRAVATRTSNESPFLSH